MVDVLLLIAGITWGASTIAWGGIVLLEYGIVKLRQKVDSEKRKKGDYIQLVEIKKVEINDEGELDEFAFFL